MQRSFSLVMDEDSPTDFTDDRMIKKHTFSNQSHRKNLEEMDDGDDDIENNAPKIPRQMSINEVEENPSGSQFIGKIPSAGPSGRHAVLKPKSARKNILSNSESDLDDSDEEKNKDAILGEYDPKLYDHLSVNAETKEIFQYITKYIPQPLTLDYRFKPFVPEFLPAVGDIDAFLKVIPPTTFLKDHVSDNNAKLGLVVLDEPTTNQSDSALLHLQLRAESVNSSHHNHDVIVKKVDNVEKNIKTIDKWIKDVSALHKTKSSPSVKYTETMPDLDELMQEWPEDVEKEKKYDKFPEPRGDLNDYIEKVCEIFKIPSKNKVESLHLLFSLYEAVKSSQLFKNTQMEKSLSSNDGSSNVTADQLVLE